MGQEPMIAKHPTQPLVKDERGVLRFKSNAIVLFILDQGTYDMNKIDEMGFSVEDRDHFDIVFYPPWSYQGQFLSALGLECE
jgi:hypothetical protein